MSKSLPTLCLSLILLAACQGASEQQQATPESSELAEPVKEAAKPSVKKPAKLTAEEIAAIEATGRYGLWSDLTEVCGKGRPPAATLTWNVKDQYDGRVVVYLIDKAGEPRNFGQGGPVGQKTTGPWLRPGLTFRIRTLETRRDLAELVIGETPC